MKDQTTMMRRPNMYWIQCKVPSMADSRRMVGNNFELELTFGQCKSEVRALLKIRHQRCWSKGWF